MKQVLLIGLTALLLVPAALADTTSGSGGASAACKALQKTSPDMFGPGKTYRNLSACVSAKAQQDRVVVALAAVTCGRLSRAATVRAGRGHSSASADQYRVQVTEPGSGSVVARGRVGEHSPEVVLEHWGGDAEMLTLRSSLTGVWSSRQAGP